MKPTRISLIAAIIVGVLLAYSPAARAQDGEKKKDAPKREGRPGGPGGERGADFMKERLDKMSEELKLNEEQKKKTEAALKEQMEKMRGLRQDSSLSNEQKREKFTAAREALDKEMKKILTADQFAKYEKMPGPGRGGPGGPGGGEGKKRGEKKGGDKQ